MQAQGLSETDAEVVLKIEGKAERKEGVMFNFELAYAGIFRVRETYRTRICTRF